MTHVTRALSLLALVVIITYSARSFIPSGETLTGSGAALAFGFLLIASIQFGHIARALRTPQLTGYLLCGLVFGPQMAGLVTEAMLADLAIVKGTAVGLIALLAGAELNFRKLRPQMKAIGAVTFSTLFLSTVALFVLFYWITTQLPVASGFTTVERVAVALICANILSAFSPAVVIGLISETRATGPLSVLTMSVVVVADLVIVVTFSLVNAFARSMFPGTATATGLQALLVHVFGSLAAGVVFGALMALYIQRVQARTGLFVFALLFLAAEAGRAIHLEPLLIGLAAGLVLENATKVGGEAVVHAAEAVTLPTFAIFFAVVGAEIQLRAFMHVAPFAIAAAAVRAAAIWIGTKWVAPRAGVDPAIARKIPAGLLSQAGVAIALAVLVLNDFPPWGRVMGTVLLGSIVVNQLIGPVLFRLALVRAGEVRDEGEA